MESSPLKLTAVGKKERLHLTCQNVLLARNLKRILENGFTTWIVNILKSAEN